MEGGMDSEGPSDNAGPLRPFRTLLVNGFLYLTGQDDPSKSTPDVMEPPHGSSFLSSSAKGDNVSVELSESSVKEEPVLAALQHQHQSVEPENEFVQYIDEQYEMAQGSVHGEDLDGESADGETVPALTIRVWVIGLVLGTIGIVVNTILSFRTNQFQIGSSAFAIVSYPLGVWMSRILPRGQLLNPGPFSMKEHALAFMLSSVMAATPYALQNVVVQKHILKQDLDYAHGVTFVIVSQCLGYGFAGLMSGLIIHPTVKLWPTNLVTISLLNSLHRTADARETTRQQYPMSRTLFFVFCACAMFFWQLFPSYIGPLVSTVSVVCLSLQDRNSAGPSIGRAYGSARSGVGLLSLTLDWSVIAQHVPILASPWSLLNQFGGLFVSLWILTPFLWQSDFFSPKLGTAPVDALRYPQGFALNSPDLFDHNGARLDPTLLFLGDTFKTNMTVYEESRPLYMTTYMAVSYFNAFVAFVASLVHVFLWYGPEFRERLKSGRKAEGARPDKALNDVPHAYYWILLLITAAGACSVCEVGGFKMPWYGVILSMALVIFTITPIGTIQAVTGQQIPLNVISELVAGFIFSGNVVGVMTFKTLTYTSMTQALSFLTDLKIGHYLHVPLRSLFLVQIVATLCGSVLSTAIVATDLFSGLARVLFSENTLLLGSSNDWTGNMYRVFLSTGAIWGTSPLHFFGPHGPYVWTLAGFGVGAVLPFLPWWLHFIYPESDWHLVNVPLAFSFPVLVGELRSDLISPLAVAMLVSYYAKKYRFAWWKKYAHVLSAGMDVGAALAVILVFAVRRWMGGGAPFPTWLLNTNSPDSERCAPDLYVTCLGHRTMGESFGGMYDPTQDPSCQSFFASHS
ncbi:OPT oligopeptide transporter protein-domain-containing protein [Chytriomyces sp. MP71]|nr:OPT oligopeptide transporter protein-domain-containing protein [Chytriomyces sp. MP71]